MITDCTVNLSLSSTVIGRARANSKLFLFKKMFKTSVKYGWHRQLLKLAFSIVKSPTWLCPVLGSGPLWRDGVVGGSGVLSSHWLVGKEEGKMGGINLLAPKQCAHHPEERKWRENWIKLVTQGLTHLNYFASCNKCACTCTVLCIHTRLTLMPRREANASWPGLRAMMSPSTSRLIGRLTNWESR